MKQPTKKRQRRPWHQLFGEMLSLFLKPVGVAVHLEIEVLASPPKADILILRNGQGCWTEAQRERLPDGIRDIGASHIVIEFKYTESWSEAAVGQAYTYDWMYKSKLGLAHHEVKTFLVCSKSPQPSRLKPFGYDTVKPGVFSSDSPLVKHVTVISLNDLADEPHNAVFKTFASTRKEKRKAFNHLFCKQRWLYGPLGWFCRMLYRFWFQEKRGFMITELTHEEILALGKEFIQSTIESATPQERLEGLPAEERLKGLAAEERLKGLAAEERLKGLAAEERLAGLEPEVVEAWLRRIKRGGLDD